MSRHLANDGWNVHVLCEHPSYPVEGELPEGEQCESPNLRISRVPVIGTSRETTFQQLVFFLSFMCTSFVHFLLNPEKYELIYVSSPPIFAGITGVLISKLTRTPFVFEVRDLWPDSAIDEKRLKSGSLISRLGYSLEEWLYRQSELIVPVTEAAGHIILEKIPDAQTRVIHNGVDTDLFRPEPATGSITREFIVGFVGSMGAIHDLETLIKAAEICEDDPEIHFSIVGDSGRSHGFKELAQSAPNISWLGLQKYEDIPRHISSFDVGINPVRKLRAFRSIVTVKFFEYLACSVPVINCAEGELLRIGNESGAAITIEPGDPEKLADTIKTLKNDRALLNRLKDNARPFVVNNYQRSEKARQLSLLLAELTNSNLGNYA